LEEEIAKVHEELKSYQQTKIAKFDTSVGGLVKQIVSTVLVNGLTIQNQDQLTYEALEAAKKEGMFFIDDEQHTP
jgi:hypothetical protein